MSQAARCAPSPARRARSSRYGCTTPASISAPATPGPPYPPPRPPPPPPPPPPPHQAPAPRPPPRPSSQLTDAQRPQLGSDPRGDLPDVPGPQQAGRERLGHSTELGAAAQQLGQADRTLG